MTVVIPKLLITAGEPAGIGPDLAVALCQSEFPAQLVVIGDPALLQQRAHQLGLPLSLLPFEPERAAVPHVPGSLHCLPAFLQAPARAGVLERLNAAYVLDCIAQAGRLCLEGRFDALITAPVHKGIINDAGILFSGHTEFLAEQARCDAVMMLVARDLRIALATMHIPLARVPAAITEAAIRKTIAIMHAELRGKFGIANPKIAVLGLNPHAGEGGHIGKEEIDVLQPAIAALKSAGMQILGPLSADTAFLPQTRAAVDAYLAMYHDQGLPVLKTAGFGEGVNVTLGLPYARVSVDHGTALALAGSGEADVGSMVAATQLAIELARGHRS